ncbi:ABC transporter permease [Iamia majanohamensis]|uniref:Molybdenum transport system permease n=2 Tax=Iamia majanohamensis TaxID=467976 RepID=A0AAF0BX46_9ACTN|nr:ABC transporter permease [Iamia majanohamensis]WCO68635.1 ABC transporter permease [Iamia majanohamensis]
MTRGPAATPSAGRVPAAMVPLALVAVGFLVLPLVGLLQRTPWSELGSILATGEVRDALRLSLVTALCSTALCLVLGVPLGWVLARAAFPGRRLLRGLVTLPMVLPPVVGGAALLFALGRRSPVGGVLADTIGFTPFSTTGVVLAQTFVALPFLVVTLEGGLRSVDRGLEEAAATLGAGRWTVLRRVTLPQVAPSLLAGAVLAWARALGEFGATITFAGNLQGRTQTMPLAVYQTLQGGDQGAAIVLSLVLVAVSLAVLVALRGRWLPTR